MQTLQHYVITTEAAKILDITSQRVRHLMEKGVLRSQRIGREFIFNRAEVIELTEKRASKKNAQSKAS